MNTSPFCVYKKTISKHREEIGGERVNEGCVCVCGCMHVHAHVCC